MVGAADGDQNATFKVGAKPVELTVQDWGGFIGQWWNRTWNKKQESTAPGREPRTTLEYTGLKPGFIKRSPVAWYSDHRHTAEGENEPYAYSYLYAYAIDLPANAQSLTLPDNSKVRVLAVSVADEAGEVRPAQPLYDTLGPAVE